MAMGVLYCSHWSIILLEWFFSQRMGNGIMRNGPLKQYNTPMAMCGHEKRTTQAI